ncbi:MAG: hypothetical protein HY703_00355 [Gemmatimonadetes bacterium]|nr:hypothetical protein [Gemmatimonadota bacterium]
MILIVDGTPARGSTDSPADADFVIPRSEVHIRLGTLVGRAAAQNCLGRLAGGLARTREIPAGLRSALCVACKQDPPFRSIKALAVALHTGRGALWEQWHRTDALRACGRLEDFIDWLVLLRCIAQKEPGLSWARAAASGGVTAQMLRRFARRLLDRRPSDLSPGNLLAPLETFCERVVHPLRLTF